MHVCYVLTSDGWCAYTQMTFLSANSLKRIHPEANIVLLTDPASKKRLEKYSHLLSTVISEIRVCPIKIGSPTETNRELKTTMPRWMEGDFLYLDADTLILRPINDIWKLDAPLAMARDREDYDPPDWIKDLYRQMGWQFRTGLRLNAGVIFVRQDKKVRELFDLWNRTWRAQVERTRIPNDQESLAISLYELGYRPHVLDQKYNYLIKRNFKMAEDVRILHFFASSDLYKGAWILDKLLEQVAMFQPIDWSLLDRCVQERHPWHSPTPYLLRSSGNFLQAMQLKLRQYFCRHV